MKNNIIPVVLIDPDYEEEVQERPLRPDEIRNILARGYTLSIQGLGTIKMDFVPKADLIFDPHLELVDQLRKIYPV